MTSATRSPAAELAALLRPSLLRLTRIVRNQRVEVLEGVGPGGVFGEMALVDQSPRVASAAT